jgi:hypothetical protein
MEQKTYPVASGPRYDFRNRNMESIDTLDILEKAYRVFCIHIGRASKDSDESTLPLGTMKA